MASACDGVASMLAVLGLGGAAAVASMSGGTSFVRVAPGISHGESASSVRNESCARSCAKFLKQTPLWFFLTSLYEVVITPLSNSSTFSLTSQGTSSLKSAHNTSRPLTHRTPRSATADSRVSVSPPRGPDGRPAQQKISRHISMPIAPSTWSPHSVAIRLTAWNSLTHVRLSCRRCTRRRARARAHARQALTEPPTSMDTCTRRVPRGEGSGSRSMRAASSSVLMATAFESSSL